MTTPSDIVDIRFRLFPTTGTSKVGADDMPLRQAKLISANVFHCSGGDLELEALGPKPRLGFEKKNQM